MKMEKTKHNFEVINNESFSELMTESELIQFLRIPNVSKAKDYHNVIRNLIRFDDLPRIKICKRNLYPKNAVIEWIDKNTIRNSLDAK